MCVLFLRCVYNHIAISNYAVAAYHFLTPYCNHCIISPQNFITVYTMGGSSTKRKKRDSSHNTKKKHKRTDSNSMLDAVTDTRTRKRDLPPRTNSRSGSQSTKRSKGSTSVDKSGGDNKLDVARGGRGNSASSSSTKSSGGKSASDESSDTRENSALTNSIIQAADDEEEETPLLVDTAAKTTAEIMPSSPVTKVSQYFANEERKINNSMWPFLWALQYNEKDDKIKVGMPDVNHNDLDISLALGILCSVCGIPAIGNNGRSSNENKLHLAPSTDVKVMMVPFVDDKARTVSADNQSFTRI